MMNKAGEPTKKSPINWAIGAVIAVLIICALNWYFLYGAEENRGTFGDMFGASNAIFSGLALVGLIYAIIQQQEQLDLAREELSTARSDLRETKKLSKEQSDHIQKQNELALKRDAENTFFQLLTLCQKQKDNISYSSNFEEVVSGLSGLEAIRTAYIRGCRNEQEAQSAAEEFWGPMNCMPYCVSLRNILFFLEENFDDYRQYLLIVLGTLTNFEIGLLGMYSVQPNVSPKLKHLLERNGVFAYFLLLDDDKFTQFFRANFSRQAFEYQK